MAQKETVDTAVIVRHYEESKGCPHCSFEAEADAYEVDRLLDGNMMVWDIRRDTDAMGFCHEHYSKLVAARSRFTVAVMLESHLREIQNVYLKEASFKKGKGSQAQVVNHLCDDCYICNRMIRNMQNFNSGVAALWKKREDFRQLFAQKGNLCLHHYGQLLAVCEDELDAKTFKDMSTVMFANERKILDKLADEAKFYCSRFDYRLSGAEKDFGETADILERMCEWLNKKKPVKP